MRDRLNKFKKKGECHCAELDEENQMRELNEMDNKLDKMRKTSAAHRALSRKRNALAAEIERQRVQAEEDERQSKIEDAEHLRMLKSQGLKIKKLVPLEEGDFDKATEKYFNSALPRFKIPAKYDSTKFAEPLGTKRFQRIVNVSSSVDYVDNITYVYEGIKVNSRPMAIAECKYFLPYFIYR